MPRMRNAWWRGWRWIFPREHEPCPIGSDRALDNAIITAPQARDPALLGKLDAVAGRLFRAASMGLP
jgi:hypothetical protein